MLSVFREHGVVAKDSRDNSNQTAENRSIYQLVHPGWLVTNRMKAWQGSVGISTLRGIVSGHYICFAPRHRESARYLNWLLRSSAYADGYALISRGVRIGQAEIDNDMFRVLPVLLPPHSEQEGIADFLDRETAQIDKLIAKQEQLIDTVRERRQAMVRHWIERPQAGDPRTDKLGRRSRIGNGSTPRRDESSYWLDGDFPWLNSSFVNQPRVVNSDQFVTSEALRQCHLPIVSPGSLLVGLTGQGKTRGSVTILDVSATISQHLAFVTPDKKYWDPEYLLWALTAAYDELRSISDENGSTKGGLTCEDLKRFRLVMPTLDTQREISRQLQVATTQTERLIDRSLRLIELSKERRAALITSAVTGQIDVRERVS
ncbi:MAG: restriction endonuclease subunit S [Actinobacteria bacterium]|nr:restriction endonuclease subunit S [Actinomycetota bacterium]